LVGRRPAQFVVNVTTPPDKVAAFFDLDRTLLTVNSGALWMMRERRLGRISLPQFIQGLFYLVGYKFSVIDMDRVIVKALHTIKDEREDTVRKWTQNWYRDEVAAHAAPGAWPVLERHRTAGNPLVLLTTSSPYESAAAAEQFGMDSFLCTRYEVAGERFTGYPIKPICYGEGKVTHAARYAAEHGIDLGASYFYTDSMSDLPMLERVGNPRVVNPDPRLKRLARARGWQILSWHRAR
jgi:HAD superfamily hydrolase (TIGR01490 family)